MTVSTAKAGGLLLSRRRFLAAASLIPAVRPAALWASRIVRSNEPRIEEFDFADLLGPLTRAEDFYLRDHFNEPRLLARSWRLEVDGRVRSPHKIAYAELLRESGRQMTVTLECAGNPVGGGGLSTAEWTGVPLAKLLTAAGLHSGVKQIRFTGADGGAAGGVPNVFYARSVPVEKALHPDTLVAVAMNKKPLSVEHGYPARVIVPGWYAMDSVKWLARIEALDHEDTSPAMTQQYVAVRMEALGASRSPVTEMKVKSQIAWPVDGAAIAPGRHSIRGAAWAGANAVERVEVSTNGGQDWRAASLDSKPEQYAWVLWSIPWEARKPGEYQITARATDNRGVTQPAARDTARADAYELNWQQSVRCVGR